MQALILAGGEGTRLRPLTSNTPKPVVPFVDRPFIAYMLEWLRGHGVDDVVMSCGFRADGVRSVLGDGGDYGMRIRYVEEDQPLGTGGALKHAEGLLDERFLMLNGDSLADLDLSALVAQHEETGATGTLTLVEVEDPANYGLVRLDSDRRVTEFIEKPSADVASPVNTVSAGAYVLERSVLELLEPGARASIERDVFPRLVGDGLYGRVITGYWLDIGTPERYLQGTFDILEGVVSTEVLRRLDDGMVAIADDVEGAELVSGAAIVEAGCRIGDGARVGGRVMLGRGVTVGEQSIVERAVVLEGATVGAHCVLRNCVIGPGATIGDRCHVEGLVLIGEGVELGADNVVAHGARVFPGVVLPDSALKF